MTEFWEAIFADRKAMWGYGPASSAIEANALFLAHGIKNVLIPGFGYGRNAEVFRQSGMTVTGIEISQSAIDIAHAHYGADLNVHHGSVSDMPFDDQFFDGIYSYALIHLLGKADRHKLVADCYRQLKPGGLMVFITISKEDGAFGKGTEIEPDRFEEFKGVQIYFYDAKSVAEDFGEYGLLEQSVISENYAHAIDQPPRKFIMVTCRK